MNLLILALNLFTPLWLAWGVIFLAIEGAAIWARATKREPESGTLSAHIWRFIGPGHGVRRALFALGWAVLTMHLFLQIP